MDKLVLKQFSIRNSEDSSQVDAEETVVKLDSFLSPSSHMSTDTTTMDVNPWPFIDEYFTFIGDKGNNFEYQCNMCLPKLKMISANKKSLYNLKMHVNRVHPNRTNDLNTSINTGAMEKKRSRSTDGRGADTRKKFRHQIIDQVNIEESHVVIPSALDTKIITFFVDNLLPWEVVDSESFQDLIKTGYPGENIISSHTLSCRVEERFALKTRELKDLLSNPSIKSVATTADAWSCQNRSYLGMTVHWIDEATTTRRKSLLACRRLFGQPTFDVLAKAIETVHLEFRIENKVIKTTTDNGSNFIKAFRVFADDRSDPSRLESGNMNHDQETVVTDIDALLEEHANSFGDNFYVLPKHARCAAHSLNLVATTDAEKAMASNKSYKKANIKAFDKARELWNKQCRTTQAADIIKSKLKQVLVVPAATSWNSVYDSVVCLVSLFEENINEVNRVCSSLKIPTFSTNDVTFFKEYAVVMKPLAVALEIIQSEEKAFMGLLLPLLTVCINKLKSTREKNLIYCEQLVDAILEGIYSRFRPQLDDRDYILAAAFHPQFKLSWFEGDIEDIESTMAILVNEKLSFSNTNGNSNYEGEDSPETFFNQLKKSSSKNNDGERLVRNYLESPLSTVLPCQSVFPCKPFMDLFVYYNTPIPSSAAVERMFSLENDLLKPKRASLSDDHFQMLVFLKGK